MAALHAGMLLIGLLASICHESFQAGGWTEIKEPDTYWCRAMAEFAYRSKKRHIRGSLIFFITQARYKVVAGTEYQLGFIVFINDALKEKCIVKMLIPPIGTPGRKATVTKLWCR
uniref:Cystatin n=1 Tax=Rhipicephalus appendiculatus TaxID=34631 RepID=A0A131YDE0_RHIAP